MALRRRSRSVSTRHWWAGSCGPWLTRTLPRPNRGWASGEPGARHRRCGVYRRVSHQRRPGAGRDHGCQGIRFYGACDPACHLTKPPDHFLRHRRMLPHTGRAPPACRSTRASGILPLARRNHTSHPGGRGESHAPSTTCLHRGPGSNPVYWEGPPGFHPERPPGFWEARESRWKTTWCALSASCWRTDRSTPV